MILEDKIYDDINFQIDYTWRDIILNYGDKYNEEDLKDTIIDILKGL